MSFEFVDILFSSEQAYRYTQHKHDHNTNQTEPIIGQTVDIIEAKRIILDYRFSFFLAYLSRKFESLIL